MYVRKEKKDNATRCNRPRPIPFETAPAYAETVSLREYRHVSLPVSLSSLSYSFRWPITIRPSSLFFFFLSRPPCQQMLVACVVRTGIAECQQFHQIAHCFYKDEAKCIYRTIVKASGNVSAFIYPPSSGERVTEYGLIECERFLAPGAAEVSPLFAGQQAGSTNAVRARQGIQSA